MVRDCVLELLRDPLDGSRLALGGDVVRRGEQIVGGTIVGTSGSYPIVDGIPRFTTRGCRTGPDGGELRLQVDEPRGLWLGRDAGEGLVVGPRALRVRVRGRDA